MNGLRRALLAGLVLLALVPRQAAAADTGWTIESFHSDITIRSSGTLDIVEAIDVDLGVLEKHGIFRDLPTRYRYDDRRDRTYALTVLDVADGSGRPLPYQVTRGDARTEIRIGDAARTVSGRQRYRIHYTVRGALNAFPDHGELYWNVNGAEWGVPTRQASVTVQGPPGSLQHVACFAGPAGATAACAAAAVAPDGRTASASAPPLAPGEELTIVVALRPDAVTIDPPLLVDRPRGLADLVAPTPLALGGAVTVLGAGLVALWWLWWTRGRDRGRPRGAIVAEYEPPDGLRPAQLGLLVDEVADRRDLIATIVDLAVRGRLVITEHPKAGLFGRTDWTLTRRAPGDDLLPYERTLFDGLFRDGDAVTLSSLRGSFAPTLLRAESELYADARSRGWFVADPGRVRAAYAGLGCLTAFAGAGLAFALGQAAGLGLVGLALVPVGLALVVLNRAMPARTAAGAALFARTLGFRRYLETAETDRARFAEREGLFTAYLPYAVMFDLVQRWLHAFAGLDLTRAVSSFYVGPGPFDGPAFASSFGDLTSTLDTTVAATPGGSGGSGFSGGSAGGGGGGGGGGSW